MHQRLLLVRPGSMCIRPLAFFLCSCSLLWDGYTTLFWSHELKQKWGEGEKLFSEMKAAIGSWARLGHRLTTVPHYYQLAIPLCYWLLRRVWISILELRRVEVSYYRADNSGEGTEPLIMFVVTNHLLVAKFLGIKLISIAARAC